jgi:serine phosphatase RsbU (regulator of sigma subunit)
MIVEDAQSSVRLRHTAFVFFRGASRAQSGGGAMISRSKARRSSLTPLWRLLFREREVTPPPSDPLRCDAPALRHAEIAAIYTGQRVAGDFYEFLRVGPSRMLFVLLDIAGLRAETRELLIGVQKTFRSLAPALFGGEDFNETIAMSELCHEMNRAVMRKGLRSCPAFVGCYNEDLGTVCYANAGHPPGMLRDRSGITLLEATGLPLGLFSHTMQSAAVCHLLPGSALLIVSRGIIEAERPDDDDDDFAEFGLAGVRHSFAAGGLLSAHDVCLNVLQSARQFTMTGPTHNDLTALALVRNVQADRTLKG